MSSRGLSLSDCLMSGLAIFALKYPSLLRFDRDARGLGEPSAREENLHSLFGIGRALEHDFGHGEKHPHPKGARRRCSPV